MDMCNCIKLTELDDEEEKIKKLDKRGRPKSPYSKPEHNPDGLFEEELKMKQQAERGQTRTYKKRHLKDLSAATRAEIVRLYKEDHMF